MPDTKASVFERVLKAFQGLRYEVEYKTIFIFKPYAIQVS